MKRFEDFLAYEMYKTDCAHFALKRRKERRSLTRMERKRNKERIAYIVSVIAWAIAIVLLIAFYSRATEPEYKHTSAEQKAVQLIPSPINETAVTYIPNMEEMVQDRCKTQVAVRAVLIDR